MSVTTFDIKNITARTEADRRIFEFVRHLINSGKIYYESEFYDNIGMAKQNYRSIKVGITSFSATFLKTICETYNINANWVFGLEKNMFRTD